MKKTRIPAATLTDISILEKLAPEGDADVRIRQCDDAADWRKTVKLYCSGTRIALSDNLPILEKFGLKVADYRAMTHDRADGAQACLYTFILTGDNPDAQIAHVPALEAAMRGIWRGEAEADDFCRLITHTGLSWQAVAVFRAYARYLRQTGFPLTGDEIAAALARNGKVVVVLMRLFAALFDPDLGENRASAIARQKKQTQTLLDAVEQVEDDRILRKYLMLIEATLRTNYYRHNNGTQPCLAFKFDSRAVEGLPPPRPLVEIFVSSPRTEGIHLRGGKVSRGGIRWSDRQADFRTEIHGLLKAQRIKNVVIVPEGSKGGFVVRHPPADANALRQEALACYQTFIRGMLDLTDNIVGDAVVAPRRVICRDGRDPYLVVAADKGTATFSDAANQIAAEYNFWLGDAFASGGLAGYDHKKMGITARGAWEAVRRHFREMGRDIQNEEFSVIGVGDMSGDVFGNALLLSTRIRLLGAFDHRHIFLDPNADAARGYRERQRLFNLPQSAWSDYNASALGAGGGIFSRAARTLVISDAARALLNLPDTRATPNAVINALLKVEADLLWLGGIGTYVKASCERHEQVDDHACDAIRVDADQLRCKVVGEGANLGFTQRARIEYALHGGRINTDAIDNAGGVNCSDHEVNIKILLAQAMKADKLDREERDALLASMTNEVAALVLRDNYLQSQALSVALANAPQMIDTHQRLMQSLEHSGHLDRKLVSLPDDNELRARRAAGLGLLRPELAMLLAYTKIAIYSEVIHSELPDAPLFSQDLAQYFPVPLQQRFAAEIEAHPLRREIVATMMVNDMVNRVGSGFVNDLQERTGSGDAEAMRAYAVVRDVFDLERYWSAVEKLDGKVSGETQVLLLLEARKLVEAATLWALRNLPCPIDVSATVRRFGHPVARLIERLPELINAERKKAYNARLSAGQLRGVPVSLARRYAALRDLEDALDMARLAERLELPIEQVGRACFQIHEALHIPALQAATAAIPCHSALENMAVLGLRDQLSNTLARLAERLFTQAGSVADADNTTGSALLEKFLAGKSFQQHRLQAFTADLQRGDPPSLALLSVISQTLSMIAEN
ncbi:MAG: NAD-glutamate dehydrogenase [Zoogloeaceae bacterium]|jgi:glutamate dehydrogenase|nr:NAD-glutamate dehydrogenase [Zoogloeaceae bacterium]